MRITQYWLQSVAVLAFLLGTSQAGAYPLQPKQIGNITYLQGGIGDEERNAMATVKSDYNLSIMSAAVDGSFVGDTRVIISDRQGNALLDVNSGPLFYAKLPPGKYTVQGMSEGQVHKQNVTVAESQPVHLHFSWK